MPFPVRFPQPTTAAAIGVVLATVALRRYLSSTQRLSASTTVSADRSSGAGADATLVVSGKSPEDQELLAFAAGSIAMGVVDAAEKLSITLAPDAAVAGGFDAGAYMGALRTRQFGRWMLWSPRLPSTQDLVAQNFTKLPVGVVCVADVQFKGRGRSKNVWELPSGCLTFSFTS